jgi:Protein of unknown function (DUF551)
MEIPEIDKQVTAEIHAELAGQTIGMICPVCHGEHRVDFKCENCNDTGWVTMSQWIKCSDDTPENGVTVLVIDEASDYTTGYMKAFNGKKPREWVLYGPVGFVPIYWMPLPEPPKRVSFSLPR